MDIAGRLQQLEEMVNEAKSMPLSSSVLINKDEVMEMLRQMQEDLPEEIKQARWIVKDREELLAKARVEGDKLIEQAREEQLRMARKEVIVVRANEEAERRIMGETNDSTNAMKRRGGGLRRREARAVRDRPAQGLGGVTDRDEGPRAHARSGGDGPRAPARPLDGGRGGVRQLPRR